VADKGEARIAVRVQPNAARSEALGFKDGCLRVKIAAPPVKGKANQELLRFLSGILKVSKSNITIRKGVTSKTKVIDISGLSQEQLMEFDWKK
jgi:uncharacterized protein (TIGR00251 family)